MNSPLLLLERTAAGRIFTPDPVNRLRADLVLSDGSDGLPIRVSHISSGNILSSTEKNDLQARVSLARSELKGVDSLLDRHKIIVKHFTNPTGDPEAYYLAQNEIIQQFVRDSREANYTKTADLIDLHSANFIIGEFKVPYNQDLKEKSLELITFDQHPIKPELKRIYPSNAVAVRNTASTPGFANELNVAYFRENMVGVDGTAAHAKAYYFVDKFLNRIKKYSLPTLRDFVDKNSFTNFRQASQEQLLSGIANWLSAHEFFHSNEEKTPLPRILRDSSLALEGSLESKNRAYGYKLKDTKTTGAFEELRVDTNAILATFDPKSTSQFGFNQDKVARELIMAERIIRYGVTQNPNVGFDAITSHVLINFLANFKSSTNSQPALTFTKDGKIKLASEEILKEAFSKLAQEMSEVETKISSTIDLSTKEGLKQGRLAMNKFMLKYANAHTATDYEPSETEIQKPNYVTHPFFQKAQNAHQRTGFRWRALLGL